MQTHQQNNMKAQKQMSTQQQNNNYMPTYNRQVWMLDFKDKSKLMRALSNKVQDVEYTQKHNKPYQYGNNEDYIIIGQQLLEFFFVDFMTIRGYPNPATQCKKASDIIGTRQKILSDKNISELAINYKLNEMVQTGRQLQLKNNPKVLAETLKAVIGGQYLDKDYDLDHMRAVLRPCYEFLLGRGQITLTNTTNTNYKSQFYEMITDYKLVPKLTCEWKKVDKILEGQQDTVYIYTLEIDGLYKHSVEGLTKRYTEELLFKHCINQIFKNKQPPQKQSNNKTDDSSVQNDSCIIEDLQSETNDSRIILDVQSQMNDSGIIEDLQSGMNTSVMSFIIDTRSNIECNTDFSLKPSHKNKYQSQTIKSDSHHGKTINSSLITSDSNNMGQHPNEVCPLDTDRMLDQIIQ